MLLQRSAHAGNYSTGVHSACGLRRGAGEQAYLIK